jgi:hypothetical protein
MDIKARINIFIKSKGLTIKRFEELCDLSNGYISSMRKGFGGTKLNNVLTIFPELNREWLLYGEGSMIKPTTPTITQHNTYGHNINTQGPVQIGSTANEAEYAEVEEITGAPVLPASMYKASNTDLLEFVQTARNVGRSGISVDGIDVDMFIYVRDEALAPRYEKGDLVALQAYEGEATVIPGRLYAVNTRSNGMQLRVLLTNDQRLRDGDYLARSFNPDTFPDYVIRREDIITIFKKVFVIKL